MGDKLWMGDKTGPFIIDENHDAYIQLTSKLPGLSKEEGIRAAALLVCQVCSTQLGDLLGARLSPLPYFCKNPKHVDEVELLHTPLEAIKIIKGDK